MLTGLYGKTHSQKFRDTQPGNPLAGLLSATFKKRLERVYDQCENWRNSDYTDTVTHLDSSERHCMTI